MDDYILTVLEKQQEKTEGGKEDQVRRKLEEQVTAGGRAEGLVAENGGQEQQSQTRETLEQVLERLEEATEENERYRWIPPEKGEKDVIWQEQAQREQSETVVNEREYGFFGMRNQRSTTVEPESFSLFFQRDARRYL